MVEQTPLEQATAELQKQFATKQQAGKQLEYYSLAQILHYLQSCGIELPPDQNHQLVQLLRQLAYTETRMDNQLHFHFYC